MNKSFIVFVLIMFLNENIFSQEAEHINGGSFSKKIEYNIIVAGNDHCYNLEGKSILDRIFFGITNSPVEFVIKSSFDGASAFRRSSYSPWTSGYGTSYRNHIVCDGIEVG